MLFLKNTFGKVFNQQTRKQQVALENANSLTLHQKSALTTTAIVLELISLLFSVTHSGLGQHVTGQQTVFLIGARWKNLIKTGSEERCS